ncbi:helicase protein MOM1-like [Telopea speciosissima]|uniref:helicase protein MOM1-like n=1 Tax=Telopea speciosissima TaxID=54955 RepID=UPI001CC61D10|nr:helicase protein MOM1-like [Telopea speciosissima]
MWQPFDGSRLGDILDDFLRQRFGPDSYERVDGVVSSKKKQAAMNMFNSKERGRFVFLLESRACHTSIKLSSVDAIILFDSDWNPLIDLRGLQRIHIDSQFEQLKVFRFYTPCTVEEKILNLAKQDMYLDSSIQNINRSHCHMLLIWGASYLFSKLSDFHGGDTSASGLNNLSNEAFMNDVVKELLTCVPQNAENNNKSICSLISKVKQSGAIYSRDIPLLGESKMQLREEEPSHVFWTKLLQGRYPRWRYLSGVSHRVRKRVQYFDESPRKSNVECQEVINKRKKVTDITTDPTSLKPWQEDKRKVLLGGKEGTSGTQAGNRSQSLPRSAVNMGDINHVPFITNEISGVSEGHLIESEESRKLREAQKSLHLLLKPEISKLCEILRLPGYIKGMALRFLDYIMKNHLVNREPVAILHAFQISVCWTAASLLKHKISHKESLAHAKHHLNFECKEEEAEFIYSKLRMLKKMFHRRIETSMELKSPEDSSPRVKDVSKILPDASSSQSMASAQEELEEGEIREIPQSHNFPVHIPVKQERVTDSDKTSSSKQNDFSEFEKICIKRFNKLLQKQQEEVQKFHEIREKEKAKLDKELMLELAFIRTVHKHTSIRLDKMKTAEQDHAKKIEAHNQGWEVLKKNFESLQLMARKEERRTKAHWLEQAISGKSVEPFAKLPLPDSWFRLEQMMGGELGAAGLSSERPDPNMSFPIKPGEVLLSKITKTIPSEAAEGSVMDATLDMHPNREDRMDATVTLQSDGDGNRLDTMLDMQTNREDDGMDVSVAMQSNGNSDRMDTMLDLQPNREDDGNHGMDANVSMQSNGDSNRLDSTLNLQPNREDDRVDAGSLDMQSNVDDCRLDGTIAMHSGRDDNGVDTTVAMQQPHRGSNGMDTTCGMQSCRDENAMDVTAPERETLAGDEQHNRADSSNSVDLRSLEPTQIDSTRNSSLPLDEVLRVEHCEPPTSPAAQDEAVSSCEMQNTPEQVQVPLLHPANVLPSDGPNHDTSVTEPVQQFPLLVDL